ncbi:hypothetical protein [Methylobacterium aerolatum]|uniref:Uncharacterized protein n=1 Tax=Methylobacterium aerolatum TaxID=418708 RepID=A0ABU0HUN5_9HYPH|nr:hypothetical protein [Methylobacterium aerolatum]MDQ0446042.1 hypothetical protein [Methylobacterium aerolatum]GJD35078.1 hypothetical protein FMGBMHLM_1985 [Methylobacterium aerolatum]
MATTLADLVARAAATAHRQAQRFPGALTKDALPWAVIEAYDADVRGNLARDPRIEDERDAVLIAAVKLAETPTDEDDEMAEARHRLAGAIDGLERTVMALGLVNRQAMKQGLGEAGQRVGPAEDRPAG